jgi:sterol desaturase/sphingolipid hydroxylase (fatty acid hydroxylase superfamily)
LLVGDHHLIHHQYPNYNYGEVWLDQLCGTRRPV